MRSAASASCLSLAKSGPWAVTQLVQRLSAERVPVIEFGTNTANFPEPTKAARAAEENHLSLRVPRLAIATITTYEGGAVDPRSTKSGARTGTGGPPALPPSRVRR